MEPLVIFVLQFLWFLFAWSLIVYFVVWPWSAQFSPDTRLSGWVAPEMFRVLGFGLLVPNLSPGMPGEFAFSTAAGDSITAVLAALAFIGRRRGWRRARVLTWACTGVGTLDLLIAFPHAAATGAISHMAAQWYVPVFAGPPSSSATLRASYCLSAVVVIRSSKANRHMPEKAVYLLVGEGFADWEQSAQQQLPFRKSACCMVGAHRSNGLEYLRSHVPSYSEAHNYVQTPAVRDRRLIAASGLGDVEFARELFEELNVLSADDRELWAQMFRSASLPDGATNTACSRRSGISSESPRTWPVA